MKWRVLRNYVKKLHREKKFHILASCVVQVINIFISNIVKLGNRKSVIIVFLQIFKLLVKNIQRYMEIYFVTRKSSEAFLLDFHEYRYIHIRLHVHIKSLFHMIYRKNVISG